MDGSSFGRAGTGDAGQRAGVSQAQTNCSSCRRNEAASGCAATVDPESGIVLTHRIGWFCDDFVAERSLAELVSGRSEPARERPSRAGSLPQGGLTGNRVSTRFVLPSGQPLNTCGLTRSCGRSPSRALRRLASARLAIASRVSWVADPMWGKVTAFLSWNSGESLRGSFS